MRRRGEYFLLYSIKLRPVTLVPDFTSIGITSKPRWTMNTLFFIKTEIRTMFKAVFSKFLQHRCLAYLSSSQHHQWLAVSALFPLLQFVNNRSVKHILIFLEVGKMWSFTHFWYLFCVILHIFHTWIHNYGAKVLKTSKETNFLTFFILLLINFTIFPESKRVRHKIIIHPLLVVGKNRISCWKRQDKLLEEIGYVVEVVSISGRTTAVVRLHNSWYTHTQQLLCMRWSTVMRQLLSRLLTHPLFN